MDDKAMIFRKHSLLDIRFRAEHWGHDVSKKKYQEYKGEILVLKCDSCGESVYVKFGTDKNWNQIVIVSPGPGKKSGTEICEVACAKPVRKPIAT